MTTAVTAAPAPMPALPAHLRAKLRPAGESKANAVIVAGLGSGFISVPKISIEGKRFDLVVDGQRITVQTQDTEGNVIPAAGLNVVIVNANAGKYKTFFGAAGADGVYRPVKWQPGQEAERPVCYSFDGERPSPLAEARQSETCASCPHNVFGSLINEQGNKTRACGDGKLLAVIPVSAVKKKAAPDSAEGRAYQIKVSATALSRSREDRKNAPQLANSLSEYVGMLSNYPVDGGNVEVPVRNVITRLFFGQAQYPLLQFKLAKDPWLTEDEAAYVEERALGEDVKILVEEQGVPETTPILPAVKAGEAPPQLAAPAQQSPAPSTPAAASPAPVSEGNGGQAPKPRGRPPKAATPAPAPAAPVTPVDDEENEVIVTAHTEAAAPKPAVQPAAVPTTADQDAALAAVASLFN